MGATIDRDDESAKPYHGPFMPKDDTEDTKAAEGRPEWMKDAAKEAKVTGLLPPMDGEGWHDAGDDDNSPCNKCGQPVFFGTVCAECAPYVAPSRVPESNRGPLECDEEVGVGATTRDFEYFMLRRILDDAFKYASVGKGHLRHGGLGVKWEDQRHAEISKEVGTGFAIGQAVKKCYESARLDDGAAERELLGAITYMASAIYAIREGWRK